jgi:CheY-like chemotaxis protein
MTANHHLSLTRSFGALPVARLNQPVRLSPRLLLADDLPSIRESLGRLLRREGYRVAEAVNGRDAIDRAIGEHFDLVLLDLSMPETDGWAALERVAALKPELPVIIITAHPHQRAWVEPSGARALLEKPLDIPLLLSTVRELTGHDARAGGSRGSVRFRHRAPAMPAAFSGLPFRSGLNE